MRSLSVLHGGEALMAGWSRNRKDASSAKTQEIASQLASLRHSRAFAFPPLFVAGLVECLGLRLAAPCSLQREVAKSRIQMG
jgi:hypothetical protein